MQAIASQGLKGRALLICFSNLARIFAAEQLKLPDCVNETVKLKLSSRERCFYDKAYEHFMKRLDQVKAAVDREGKVSIASTNTMITR